MATATPQYKIGDEVEIMGNRWSGYSRGEDTPYHDISIRTIATVISEFDGDDCYDGSYNLQHKNGDSQWVRPCDFRLVEDRLTATAARELGSTALRQKQAMDWHTKNLMGYPLSFYQMYLDEPKEETKLKTKRKNKMTKLTQQLKKMLGSKQATILEAFTRSDGSLDVSSSEFAEWFIAEFMDNKPFLAAAKARLERDKEENK